MPRIKNDGLVAIALLTVLFAFNASPAETQAARDHMLQAIGEVAARGNATVPAKALNGALERASALTAIQVDASDAKTSIRFAVTGTPAFAASANDGFLRIQFADTVVLPNVQTMVIGSQSASAKLSTSLISLHPQFVTQVDVALPKSAHVEARRDNGSVLVTISAAKELTVDAPQPAQLAASRAIESAARLDAVLAQDFHTIDAAVRLADDQMAQSELYLLQAELMLVADTQSKSDPASLRKEFERNQSQTALLAAEFQTTIERRADRISGANASLLAEPAFSTEESKFAAAIAALRSKAEQQAELNLILARRMEQACNAISVPRQASNGNALEQMDVAFASMRNAPATTAQNKAPVEQRSNVAAVESAPIALTVAGNQAHAALADRDVVSPPAPRARDAGRQVGLEAIARPDKMAVLRSSEDELAQAESNGVIRLAQADGLTEATGARPATPVNGKESADGPRRYRVPKTTGTRPAFNLYNEGMPASEDPLRQLVNIDFRDMELSNVVSLLAQKGQINVIAGTEVTGTVTANLKNIPLGRAIEIVLRMNGLGIVEEAGVYRITSYEEAIASQRETRMIFLQNAQADEVKTTLEDILAGRSDGDLIAVSANPSTNVILVGGPLEAVEELEGVIEQLDVAEPVIPTITMPIKLNYSEPLALLPVVQSMISEESGSVSADARSRHLIVTDTPVKVQEIQSIINSIDLPVKQVIIDAMIVDAELEDAAATGVDWVLETIHQQPAGPDISFSDAFAITNPAAGAATLAFGVISDSINLRAEIQARVESSDSQLLNNPVIVTVENQPALINISEEIPYQELTSTSEGGQISSTKFKDIGTVLTVTPRVTHDNHILVTVDAKQSNTTGLSVTGVPIESKRQASTTLRMEDGQSIFIGGLRAFDEELSNRKVPVLGDIPVLNTFFKSQDVTKRHKELLIFLTCNVLPDQNYPELTPFQKEKFDLLGGMPRTVDGTRALVGTYIHPEEQRDPIYKWRRSK